MKTIRTRILVLANAVIFLVTARGLATDRQTDEATGKEYMKYLDVLMSKLMNEFTIANSNYEINITKHNEEVLFQASLEYDKKKKQNWKETITYNWQEYEDEDLRRMFKKYSEPDTSALPDDQNERLIAAVNNMTMNYAKAKICDYNNGSKCDLHIEPEVTDIFATSNDPEELKYVWLEWHRVAGAPSRDNFTEYVTIKNEAAKLNGYHNAAEWWLSCYETPQIEEQFSQLWDDIKPLYQQLHAYVRRQLRLKYGDSVVSARGPIPAHLLGTVWADTWTNVEKFTKPYPEKLAANITAALIAQNYTALKMFKTAEEFFTSLNLSPMTELFWERSIIEKPDDGREILCHATAFDFFDGNDFRIKQCTKITGEFFEATHHEMGHIEYYMQYKHQPVVYKEGANPGFHEAIGDVIALSARTPKHLRKIGLLENGTDDFESKINQLYKMGLEKIAFLPYGFLLDLIRYGVFRGITTAQDYNCHYWQLRESVQGLEPPTARSEEDFDPAAMMHISGDIEYMRYYVSFIVQFQFHRALCQYAGEYNVDDSSQLLSDCDIYQSTEAGNALSKMLQMGSSKPWQDAMEMLTGTRSMNASSILEYFKPLYDWLKAENERTDEFIGWEPSVVPYCTSEQRTKMENSDFSKRLKKYASL